MRPSANKFHAWRDHCHSLAARDEKHRTHPFGNGRSRALLRFVTDRSGRRDFPGPGGSGPAPRTRPRKGAHRGAPRPDQAPPGIGLPYRGRRPHPAEATRPRGPAHATPRVTARARHRRACGRPALTAFPPSADSSGPFSPPPPEPRERHGTEIAGQGSWDKAGIRDMPSSLFRPVRTCVSPVVTHTAKSATDDDIRRAPAVPPLRIPVERASANGH